MYDFAEARTNIKRLEEQLETQETEFRTIVGNDTRMLAEYVLASPISVCQSYDIAAGVLPLRPKPKIGTTKTATLSSEC
jgi:hypothetical protein